MSIVQKYTKKIITALFVIMFFNAAVFASEAGFTAFVEGCRAYSKEDWNTAVFLLKKAVAYSENNNADTHYMLITAEISAGDEKNALADCDSFLRNYQNSIYVPRIKYLKGKTLYSLGEYEKAIVALGDFCHQNENNELYSSALFYIGEALYAGYKYDEAEDIYERIVTEFPESEKVSAAQYRIESIAQRSREEKLLYLLKQTGEEYLAAKEDYERQLKLYNSEAINTTRERLQDAQQKNKDLELQIKELEEQIAVLKENQRLKELEEERIRNERELSALEAQTQSDDAVRRLKEKAQQVQFMLDMGKSK